MNSKSKEKETKVYQSKSKRITIICMLFIIFSISLILLDNFCDVYHSYCFINGDTIRKSDSVLCSVFSINSKVASFLWVFILVNSILILIDNLNNNFLQKLKQLTNIFFPFFRVYHDHSPNHHKINEEYEEYEEPKKELDN